MPTFWQLGAVAPQSFNRLLKVVPGSTWLAGGAPGAAGTGAPGGAVAVRLEAMDADSVRAVPGRTERHWLGAVIAVPAVTTALIPPTLVRVLKVAGFCCDHFDIPPLRNARCCASHDVVMSRDGDVGHAAGRWAARAEHPRYVRGQWSEDGRCTSP